MLTAHSCTFMSSEIGQTCSLAFMSPFECTVFEFIFFVCIIVSSVSLDLVSRCEALIHLDGCLLNMLATGA